MSELTITRVAHAAVLLGFHGHYILTDPWFSHKPGYSPGEPLGVALDELPQLWNVLRGDMSIVGPRPDQLDQLQYYTEAEKAKLRVKPGLTGLAQINGRNAIPWQARKALDVEYVNRQSLALDVLILVKTIPYVLFRNGVNAQ